MQEKITFQRAAFSYRPNILVEIGDFLDACLTQFYPREKTSIHRTMQLLQDTLFPEMILSHACEGGSIRVVNDQVEITVRLLYEMEQSSDHDLSVPSLQNIEMKKGTAVIRIGTTSKFQPDPATGQVLKEVNATGFLRVVISKDPQERLPDQIRKKPSKREGPFSFLPEQQANLLGLLIEYLGLQPPLSKEILLKLNRDFHLWSRQDALVAVSLMLGDTEWIFGKTPLNSDEFQAALQQALLDFWVMDYSKKSTNRDDPSYAIGVYLERFGTQEEGWQEDRMPARRRLIGIHEADFHPDDLWHCRLALPIMQEDANRG